MTAAPAPLISVVIPSYMHGHLIGRALQSLLDQTYQDWEAIVVDNHSSDQTELVVAKAADPRIRLVKIRNNGIIAASRNQGIREARGAWIAFLDSDDWWAAEKLQECVNRMGEDVDLIYHDLEISRDKATLFGARRIKARHLRNPVLIDLLVNGNAIANSSVVVRKSVLAEIGGLNESRDIVACEDYHGWLKIAELGKHFCYIPKSLGYYYQNSQGMSLKDMSVPAWAVVSPYFHLLDDGQRRKLESALRYTRGRYYFIHGNYNAARQELLPALLYSTAPIRLKALTMIALSALRPRASGTNSGD